MKTIIKKSNGNNKLAKFQNAALDQKQSKAVKGGSSAGDDTIIIEEMVNG